MKATIVVERTNHNVLVGMILGAEFKGPQHHSCVIGGAEIIIRDYEDLSKYLDIVVNVSNYVDMVVNYDGIGGS